MDNWILHLRAHLQVWYQHFMICMSGTHTLDLDIVRWPFTLQHDVTSIHRPLQLIKDD